MNRHFYSADGLIGRRFLRRRQLVYAPEGAEGPAVECHPVVVVPDDLLAAVHTGAHAANSSSRR